MELDNEEALRQSYQSGEKLDPRFTQLYEMFISDFREFVDFELKKIEQEEAGVIQERWPLIVDSATMEAVHRDVARLSPLSSIGKVLEKEIGDKSTILDYEKEENQQDYGVLSSDLMRRFRSLHQWVGWVKVKPTPIPPTSPKETTVTSQLELNRWHRRTSEEFNKFKPPSPSNMSSTPKRGLLYQKPGVFEPRGSTSGVYRMVCIPRIDTGESFGGLSSLRRRIFKVSLRVINTADIEVGIKGKGFSVVEDLRGIPKTGEFDVFLPEEADVESELVIRQLKPSPFCLTSVTAHLSVED